MLSKFHEILVAYAAAMLVVEPAFRLSGGLSCGCGALGCSASRLQDWGLVLRGLVRRYVNGPARELEPPHRGSVQ